MYYDERDNLTNIYDETNKYENKLSNEETKIWDTDLLLNIDNININNFRKTSDALFTAKEGLNKGNMFKGIYVPYKNYVYNVVVKGDKDELLLKIQELSFKVVDLTLYLDVNSNDLEMYKEFKKTVEELKKYKEMYEKNYGPLCVTETEYYNTYMWTKDPWPWVNEGGKK